MLENIQDSDFFYCFLDEKWFYTSTYRRKLKELPRGSHEPLGTTTMVRPKTRSRRHPCKVMFMGIVAPPCRDCDFDGRVFIERVAIERAYKRIVSHQRFSHSGEINEYLKKREGGWRRIFDEFPNGDATIACVRNKIAELFYLDVFETERLAFTYETYVPKRRHGRKKKIEVLTAEQDGELLLGNRSIANNEGIERGLTSNDLQLQIRCKAGDKRHEDVSCDSEFMLRVMPEVGRAIREKFSHVHPDTTIHLIMDNAGGHGSIECVSQYKEFLWNEFKVNVINQIPNSPETNMLDLGAWMSIQAQVQKEHFRKVKRQDALAASVETAWEGFGNKTTLAKIHERWKKVMHLIIQADGGNELVEADRGLTSSLFNVNTEDEPNIDNDDDFEYDTGDEYEDEVMELIEMALV